jgi:methyl-coenzyme M reductase subunit D
MNPWNGGKMESASYPQIRIVPIRMLQAENAEKFLDGLSYIPGIRRILVHGPGHLKTPEKPEEYYEPQVPSSTEVKIAEQPVNIHVLVGDVIIEAVDERGVNKVAKFCEEFFDDLSFHSHSAPFIQSFKIFKD